MSASHVHCAVCVNVGDMTRPADTTIGRYRVCDEHADVIEKHGTLAAALAAHNRQTQRKAT